MRKGIRTLLTGLACTSSALVAASAADAQVVIMRKMMPFKPGAQPVVEGPVTTIPGEEPVVVNPNAYYSWVVSPWKQEGVCGSQGVQTRVVTCKRTDGVPVPESRCVGNGSGPKPVASQPAEITQTCGYQWDAGAWNDPGAACTTSEIQTRDVVCRRSDGKVAEDAACGPGKPVAQQSVADFSACSYKWATGAWSAPTNQCGASTQTREIKCQRSDGTEVAESSCVAGGAGQKPAASQEAYVTSGCQANWAPSQWGKPAAACGTSVQYRDVKCVRADGVTVGDDQCILEKPAASQPAKDYSTCIDGRTPENPWGWTVGAYGPLSTTCGEAVKVRSVVCTDDEGGAVPDSRCLLAKPEAETKSLETSGCSYDWQVGSFGPIVPACGQTVKTRPVTCMRSDGKAQADSSCAQPKPATTEAATDYSSCTYGWATGTWSNWSSTCGAGTQTRTVACQRSDGTPATEDKCTQAKPDTTQSGYQTTGCTFGWQNGAWETPQACGDVTQTRRVQCVRSDGEVIDDATCAAIAAKPATTQAGKDYSACSYTWAVGTWSNWSTTCGKATSSRSVTCQRSDGTAVSDSQCASVGAKPETTQTSDQSSSCTYSWKAEPWGTAPTACGTSTQSRTVTCTRSDGTAADPSRCTGTKPVEQQSTTDYSSCGYTWEASTWSSENLCGESAVQTRTVTCRRSDGQLTPNDNCTIYGAGPKPASSQTVSSYTGCGYSWRVSYGAWSSTCSDSATRNNVVSCTRSDGAVVDDSMCSGTAPKRQDVQGVYSSCTYTPTYSTTFGACTPTSAGAPNGVQSAPIVSCARSDGTAVANSQCNPQTTSRSCAVTAPTDRYVREIVSIADPNAYSQTVASVNTLGLSTLRMAVVGTTCWDYTANASASASQCTKGPANYDIVNVPATYVPDLKEIWISQSDMLATLPRLSGFAGTALSTLCSTSSASTTIYVADGSGGKTSWQARCGKPDYSAHYVRSPATIGDPFSVMPGGMNNRLINNNANATTLWLAVQSTLCRDTVANTSVAAAKCNYLSSGANVYDLVSVPAIFSSELHEIYVNQADVQAAAGYGTYFGGTLIANMCTSTISAYVTLNGTSQTWLVRCGTPDKADRYVRSPSTLGDPVNVLPNTSPFYRTNTISNSGSVRLAVSSTVCRDTATNSNVGNTKCAYLSTGANVYDLASVPATYVKDLRELYVNQTDLQAALGYGTTIGTNPIATVCQNGFSIGHWDASAGQSQSWVLRCGAAESASDYVRAPNAIGDPVSIMPSGAAQYQNPSESASSLKIAVDTTQCWNLKTGAQSSSPTKCTYLPSGANKYDILSVPATFVPDLREIYVSEASLKALVPYGGSFRNNSIANVCSYGHTMYVGGQGTGSYWNLKCGTPEDPSRYTRYISTLGDPVSVYNDANKRYVNDTTKPSLTLAVSGTQCYDSTTKTSVSTVKCQYLPNGPKTYDQVSVAATWNTTARTVTVSKAEVQALSPITAYNGSTSFIASNAMCGRGVTVSNGVTGSYTVNCQ